MDLSALRDRIRAGRRFLVVMTQPDAGPAVSLESRGAILRRQTGPGLAAFVILDAERALHLAETQMAGQQEFLTTDIQRLTGTSPALLSDWIRDGFISPSVNAGGRFAGDNGRFRRYGRGDLYVIAVLGALTRRGLDRATLTAVAAFLRDLSPVAANA